MFRPTCWAALAVLIIMAPLALAVRMLAAATVDLSGLLLQETHVRVLTESVPSVVISCTPPGGPTPDDNFCVQDTSPFTPADLVARCVRNGCVIQLDFCLDYTLQGSGAIGAVVLEADGEPLAPGPGFVILPSTGLDLNHNRACVTQFAAGLARGPHTIVGMAGVDNNFSGATVSITVRSATFVIRVYR